MAWNRNQGGGRWNQGGGPWGQQPQGGGGNRNTQPPDLEDLLKRSQDRLKRAFPPGLGGGAMFILLAVALGAIWIVSGFYFVDAGEQAVVQRFGKFVRFETPGLRYHLPWPVENVTTPEVTRVRIVEGGSVASQEGDEHLMLTEDRNFLSVLFTVQYSIKDARQWLFNVDDPEHTVLQVAEAAMREVVGRGEFDVLQTEQRGASEIEARDLIQRTLDTYQAGIQVIEVRLQKVDPPAVALDAARDVESARQERETARNQAEAYQNRIIPEARGQAERILQDAQAYKQRVIAEAEGESAHFNSVYAQYRLAPDVTRRRMYLETMERVLGGMNKVIIDEQSGGVVPYLPLPELQRQRGAPAAAPSGGN